MGTRRPGPAAPRPAHRLPDLPRGRHPRRQAHATVTSETPQWSVRRRLAVAPSSAGWEVKRPEDRT